MTLSLYKLSFENRVPIVSPVYTDMELNYDCEEKGVKIPYLNDKKDIYILIADDEKYFINLKPENLLTLS